VDGHATWASGSALACAGITRHTSDPPGGRIARDPSGEATGLLIDMAQDLVRPLVPPPSEERFDEVVRAVIAECLAKGLTGAHEPGVDLGAVRRTHGSSAAATFPFACSRRSAARRPGGNIASAGRWRRWETDDSPWAPSSSGSTERSARAGLLSRSYCDDPGNTGLVLVPPEEVERLTREAAGLGFHVWVHAIGDRANTLVLDVFEKVRATGGPSLRLRVEHAQILAPADIPRFARLGVIPSMQPTHCTSDMRWAGERLGPERLDGAYAWRSGLDSGAYIAGGSDFPWRTPIRSTAFTRR
jgi:Predicted metal-dependent hydrolase with the TIM-barrel fold